MHRHIEISMESSEYILRLERTVAQLTVERDVLDEKLGALLKTKPAETPAPSKSSAVAEITGRKRPPIHEVSNETA